MKTSQLILFQAYQVPNFDKVPTSITLDLDQFKESLTAPIAFIDDDLEEDGALGL